MERTMRETIRVLHLEDDASDAEQIAWILKKGRITCEMKVVHSRQEYTNALKEFDPQLIISDHSLPKFDSMEALSILKNSQLEIPFILVTGTVSEDFAVTAMREGADDYILKDRPQRLPIAVIAALDKYQLVREQRRTATLLSNIDKYSLDVICSIDAQGRFIHLSASSLKIWGYEPSELQGKKYLDMVYAADAQMTTEVAEAIMAGNSVTTFENIYTRKDGSLVTMLWSATWDDVDKIMYCVAKDATEKKNAEKLLASERKRLSDLFMNAPVSMCILTGEDHVFELANPVFLQLSGKKDIIGKNLREVFPEFDGQGAFEMMDEVYKTGIAFSNSETKIKVHQNGHLNDFYLNFLQQPYMDSEGKVSGIFYFGMDISEQVKARQKIEDNKKQYVHLVQNLPTAVYTCDADGRVLLYNKAAVELWGRAPESGVDLWCGAWKIYTPSGVRMSPSECPMAKTLNEGRQIDCEEIVIERPDGSRRNVTAHPRPTFDNDGKITGAINMLVDITNDKTAAEETRNLINSLQSRNSDLQQFSYIVSHNLRAPIARILGLATIFESHSDESKFLIDKIAEETTNLDSVIRDINTIVSARKPEDKKTSFVSFDEQVHLAMQVLEAEIQESGALITTDFSLVAGMSTVKSYLYSILYNLISNAVKYRNHEKQLVIQVKSFFREEFVALSVRDTGSGIDLLRNGTKIFKLYKRFHDENIPGKGVGLNLVKTHAESLGGRVEVDSKVNEGAEFTIYLPRKSDVGNQTEIQNEEYLVN